MKKRNINITGADFAVLRTENSVYVDKTKQIYDCFASINKYYFLARPRRFGKSLLCSTLRELFSGNKKLFKGLWIEKSDWKWDKHPVIHLNMTDTAGSSNDVTTFKRKINKQLQHCAENFKISIDSYEVTGEEVLTELVQKLHKKTGKGVAIIIDEYDKPILDLVENPEERTKVHHVLRSFYAPLKSLEPYVRLVLLTGVYKFTQTSVFSNLNNLKDLTFDPATGTLIGYTEKEIKKSFAPEIKLLAKKIKQSVPGTLQKLRDNYDGYCFGVDVSSGDMSEHVYNSYAINNVFDQIQFIQKWFESGSPRFLIKKIEDGNFEALEPNELNVPFRSLQTSCSPDNITATSLLYYAGYTTMQSYNPITGAVRIGYPNLEVSEATATELLALFQAKRSSLLLNLATSIALALRDHHFDEFCNLFNQALAQIPYKIILPHEFYFQMVVLLILQAGKLRAEAEIPTNDGCMDIVIQFNDQIIIIELKFNKNAATGLKQISDKNYAKKFKALGLPMIAIGLNVVSKKKKVPQSCVVEVAWKTLT